MITLGVILLIVGFLIKIPILWTIGIIVLIIGLVLLALGQCPEDGTARPAGREWLSGQPAQTSRGRPSGTCRWQGTRPRRTGGGGRGGTRWRWGGAGSSQEQHRRGEGGRPSPPHGPGHPHGAAGPALGHVVPLLDCNPDRPRLTHA